MILTTQLIKEIGLKSFILEGMLTFRTNVIMMCLSIADLFSLKKKSKQSSYMSSLIMCQHFFDE
jgi:hypothetical protein